jgi:hypothetical protein
MKKNIYFFLLIFIGINVNAQTADEIIANHVAANGGQEKLASINTLQYTSTMKLNMMGMQIDVSSTNIIENNKLFRKNISGVMGMKGSYTLVTDTAGYVSIPTVQGYGDFPGMEGGISKMESDKFLIAKQKLNVLEEFSALINYKEKGFTAELAGKSKVDKVECFKIKLIAKDGEASVFFIDATTFLLKQIEVSGKQISSILGIRGGPMGDMMGGRMDKQKMNLLYQSYTDVNGIKFPTKLVIQLGASDIEIENSSIEINEAVDKKWYLVN